MMIISDDGFDIWIELNSGQKTVISKQDEWITKTFPVWGITGSISKYIFVERPVTTEFSTIRERIYLHRVIVRPKKGEFIDHIDRNRLNNRRWNLRICTAYENMANTGPKGDKEFKGVFKKEKRLSKPYQAILRSKQRGTRHLGYFETAEAAARAYDVAAKEVYGDFAYLNF